MHLAYLEDRVDVHHDRPQRYGTQLRDVDGRLAAFPLADLEHVDELKAGVGLRPLGEHIAESNTFYGYGWPAPIQGEVTALESTGPIRDLAAETLGWRLHQRRRALRRDPRPGLPRQPRRATPVPATLPLNHTTHPGARGAADRPVGPRLVPSQPNRLDTNERQNLDALTAACLALAAVSNHVHDLAVIMLHQRGRDLDRRMDAVQADDLHRRDLAGSLRRTGLTLPHSPGRVEGHVNRIKMIKRQMTAANPDLLRKPILRTD